MKTLNSHLSALKSLQYFPRFPKTPKVVLLGAPNVGTNIFAHRLAIDLGVPAVSMRSIYRNILTFQNDYQSETFYRKVIGLLRSNPTNLQKELEDNMIPEKLLMLTKYTELGFVLYDYPNSIKQCEK
jgi:adenylate kinase family enzyme